MEWTCSSAPITCSMGTDLEPVAYLCKRQFRRNAMIRNDYSKSRLLVIKQATAKALGVTIPESFLLRAPTTSTIIDMREKCDPDLTQRNCVRRTVLIFIFIVRRRAPAVRVRCHRRRSSGSGTSRRSPRTHILKLFHNPRRWCPAIWANLPSIAI